jgi:hypothetical protein
MPAVGSAKRRRPAERTPQGNPNVAVDEPDE